jgi:hypothetical protein
MLTKINILQLFLTQIFKQIQHYFTKKEWMTVHFIEHILICLISMTISH